MRPVIQTEYCGLSVCRSISSITVVSPIKTAEPIEMPFGLRTRVDPRNHQLYADPDPDGKGNFKGEGMAFCKV